MQKQEVKRHLEKQANVALEYKMKHGKGFAKRALPTECTGHSKQLPTTQEKTLYMDVTRWSILKSDRLYSFQPKMEKLYTASVQKLYTKTKLGADCGSDHELFIAKFRLN